MLKGLPVAPTTKEQVHPYDGHGGLLCVPETGTKWGGGEGSVMREEVSFGSGESEPLRHLIKFEKMTDISHLPQMLSSQLTNFPTSECRRQISVLRGRAKISVIIIITPTWPAKIGAAAAVETPATCERRHLSLSDGKSTARPSSVGCWDTQNPWSVLYSYML